MGLEPAFGSPLSLSAFLPAHAEVWDRIVERQNLRRVSMPALLGESHHYADLLFSWGAQTPPASTLV